MERFLKLKDKRLLLPGEGKVYSNSGSCNWKTDAG